MSIPEAQFVVNAEGKKTGVLLSVKQYEKLLEDLHQYCGQNLGSQVGNGAIVTKLFIIGAEFFQAVPPG
jgi:hypothetical protein